MNCMKWEERIASYAGGDAPQDAKSVERHLAECVECRQFAGGLRENLALLREIHEEPLVPAHFAAVRTGVLGEIERRRATVWRWGWAAGLTTAVLALVVAIPIWRRPELPPPPVLVALASPSAPAVERVEVPVRPRVTLRRVQPAAVKMEPLVIKLVTDNPDVVIYWIADKRGDY